MVIVFLNWHANLRYSYLSQTPSGLILKWLGDATINQVKKSIPDANTADGDALIQLVFQSEICISYISTAVLSKWLSDTALIQNLAKTFTPEWKTADGDTLLQLICQFKAIVSHEHGAKMMVDIVFKLITSDELDSIINEILSHSIRKQAILWNPNELNGDGYTALHLACKADNPTRVNILLSEAHCDPNVKSNNEEVPLQMTTNPEIIKDLIDMVPKQALCMNLTKILWEQINLSNLQSRYSLLEIPLLERAP